MAFGKKKKPINEENAVAVPQTGKSSHPFLPVSSYIPGCTQDIQLYRSLREAYSKISRKLGLELIPAGSCVQYFRENLPQFDYAHGGKPLTRDGFHMSIPIGRLIVALVWLEKLFGADASRSAFVPTEAADEDIALLPEVRTTVHKFMSSL